LARMIQETLFFRQHLIDILGLKLPDKPKIRGVTQLSLC
jgi:hypothetical protein